MSAFRSHKRRANGAGGKYGYAGFFDIVNWPCPGGNIVPAALLIVSGSGRVKVRKSPGSANFHSSRLPFTDHFPSCFWEKSLSAHDTAPFPSKKKSPRQFPMATPHFPAS